MHITLFPPHLKHLDVSEMGLYRFDELALPKTLVSFIARKNYFSDLAGLPYGIQELDLSANRLRDLYSIDSMSELKFLNVSNNVLTFRMPRELTSVDLRSNFICSLRYVQFGEKISHLFASHTSIFWLDGFTIPRNLRFFDLSFTHLLTLKDTHVPRHLTIDTRKTPFTSRVMFMRLFRTIALKVLFIQVVSTWLERNLHTI